MFEKDAIFNFELTFAPFAWLSPTFQTIWDTRKHREQSLDRKFQNLFAILLPVNSKEANFTFLLLRNEPASIVLIACLHVTCEPFAL